MCWNRSPAIFWWDWMVPPGTIESREPFGERVPRQIRGNSPFPGNSPGIPREYATKIYRIHIFTVQSKCTWTTYSIYNTDIFHTNWIYNVFLLQYGHRSKYKRENGEDLAVAWTNFFGSSTHQSTFLCSPLLPSSSPFPYTSTNNNGDTFFLHHENIWM